MTDVHPAEPAETPDEPARPSSFRLITPEEWWRIPLHPQEKRHHRVEQLVTRQFRGVDDQPALRRDTENRVRQTADEAAQDAGGIELYVSTQVVAGVPLAMSLLVSMLPPGSVSSVAQLHEAFAGDGELAREEIDAGPVVRRMRQIEPDPEDELGVTLTRTTVDYWVPVPAGDTCLQLSYSTPMQEPLVEALVELFDTVTASLRWVW